MFETLRPILRAAGITAFVAGTLLLLLRPPSLSGAQGLATIVAACLAFAGAIAWLTVSLAGRRSLSEPEFDRLVERSEELARAGPALPVSTEFEFLVAEAIDELPAEFRALLEDTPVVVSHHGFRVGAYGHYFGDTVAREHHEDRIVLYQDTLERDFGHDPDLLRAQVVRTLRHEVAHHLGWNERGVRDLGL